MSNYSDLLARRVGYDSYSDYLRSVHWQNFSIKVKDTQCYCCKSTKHLQVHHISYERLGQEILEDVITVCDGCHVFIHRIAKQENILLDKAHEKVKSIIVKSNYVSSTEWVSWFKLQNKSKHESLDDLKLFLIEQGLSNGESATQKAYKLGLVKLIDGKEKWHRKSYIRIMQRAKKDKKAQLSKQIKIHQTAIEKPSPKLSIKVKDCPRYNNTAPRNQGVMCPMCHNRHVLK